jgi:hypothetical protein
MRWWPGGDAARGALVLAVLVNVFFFPFLWGGKSLMSASRDIPSIYPNGAAGGAPPTRTWKLLDPYGSGALGEPNFALEHRQYFDEHRLPLWNPDVALGAPQAAAMQQQPFYPLAVPMALAPSPRAYAWYLAARFFVAGFFCFLFLRYFVAFHPALAGAVAFMLTGYFIMYCSQTHLSVEVLLGAAFYATESLLRKRSWTALLGTAALVLLTVVGGMPESTLLVLLFAYAYFVFRIASAPELRASALGLTARYAAANVLGFALAAFLLLPFAEFVSASTNSHTPSSIGGVFRGLTDVDALPAVRLPQYLVPLMYGPPWQDALAPGTGPLRGYFGLVAVLLALLALVAELRRRAAAPLGALTWFFAGAAALLVLKRFGVPVVNWIGWLPALRTVAFNKYEEPLLGFAVAALAALGAAHALGGDARRRDLAAALLAAFALLTGAYLAGDGALAAAQKHVTAFEPAFVAAFAALAAGAAVLYAALAPEALGPLRRYAAHAPAALVAVLFAELSLIYYVPMFFVVNTPPDDATNPYAGAPYVDYLRANRGAYERVIGQQTVLQPDWAEAFGLQDVRDNDALYYRKFFPFVRACLPPDMGAMAFVVNGGYSLGTPGARRLMELTSVRYVLEPGAAFDPQLKSSPDFRLAYDKDVAIYAFAHPLPRAAVYRHAELLTGERAVLDRITDPSQDVRNAAFLAGDELAPELRAPAGRLAAAPRAPAEAASITAYDSQRVEIAAALAAPGLLVLNDTDYPGWRAYVDDRPAPIVSANFLFRGVFLDAGPHRVVFRYEPASYRIGWIVSALALLCAAAYGVLGARRDRRARAGPAGG